MSPPSPFGTRIEWVAQLDNFEKEADSPRKSSIICTLGPNTSSVPMIQALRKAGMNIARLNFSHGCYEYHAKTVHNIRKSFVDQPGRSVGIALDTKGPEIRTGKLKDDREILIPQGHIMTLTADEARKESSDEHVLYMDYKKLATSTHVGRHIFVDDCQLRFEVLEVRGSDVRVKALNSWKLCSNKCVNLPTTVVDLPALSERDKADLTFGVEQGIDMVFVSFVRKAQDIREVRAHLGEHGQGIKIVAKIECFEGIKNFSEILAVADGIMVARGDLGIETTAEKVFIAQKMICAKCNAVGKPVICATQMLESMTVNPRPTRAEVSDVANAILDGADCVMLSGETAKGIWPVETVDMMHRLCREAEAIIFYPRLFNELRAITPKPTDIAESIASSAVNASLEQNAAAILVLTTSGTSARLVAKYRPGVPILTVTRSPQVARQCHLYRGCYPMVYDQPWKASGQVTTAVEAEAWHEEVDSRMLWAMTQAKEWDMLKAGDIVIGVHGWKEGSGNTSVMRVLVVPGEGERIY